MTRTKRPLSLIATALWHIESGKEPGLTLERLAHLCGVTPAHLTRAIRLSTGTSPMAYVRARALTQAARHLASTDDTILTVALDAGYGSHEAFTRAFVAAFGVRPSALRRGTLLSSLPLTEPIPMPSTAPVVLPAPRIASLEAFDVTGLSDHYTAETIPMIPALWAALAEREAEITPSGPLTYGVSYDRSMTNGFRYLAGMPTAPGAEVPPGMTRLRMPGGKYAVFVSDGHVSQMHQTMLAIFDRGLQSAGLTLRDGNEIEVYDHRFDPQTASGVVEIWIPVV